MSEIDPAPSRPLRWWDTGVIATIAVMATIGVLELVLDDAPVGATDLAVILGAPVLLTIWYVVLGRAALRRATFDEPTRPADVVFLVGVIVIIAAGTSVFANYATLQTLGYPIIWTVVARYRSAVLWSAGLAAAVGVGFATSFTRFGVSGGIWVAAIIAVISFGFAVAMGTWITRIFAQGQRYRVLAEELRRSQAEVAALSVTAGASAERERISRELHDTLTQTLAGLVMLSEQAERALAAGDTVLANDRVARVGSAAREAVSEARALVATTQPLGDGGLESAIERLVARLQADTGLRVECEMNPLVIDRERQVVLLRAAQEGLANARKHAQASRVLVSLRASPEGGALLTVEDDGVGPDHRVAGADAPGGMDAVDGGPAAVVVPHTAAPVAPHTDGYGLTGLADRVRAVGGAVRFGPGARGGARLEVYLDPVRELAEEAAE